MKRPALPSKSLSKRKAASQAPLDDPQTIPRRNSGMPSTTQSLNASLTAYPPMPQLKRRSILQILDGNTSSRPPASTQTSTLSTTSPSKRSILQFSPRVTSDEHTHQHIGSIAAFPRPVPAYQSHYSPCLANSHSPQGSINTTRGLMVDVSQNEQKTPKRRILTFKGHSTGTPRGSQFAPGCASTTSSQVLLSPPESLSSASPLDSPWLIQSSNRENLPVHGSDDVFFSRQMEAPPWPE